MTIYTDAGFRTRQMWDKNEKEGVLCVAIEKNGKVEIKEKKDFVPYQEGLKQYNNIFELKAVLFALEILAKEKYEEVKIITDSTTIRGWVKNGTGSEKFLPTPLHVSLFQELRLLKALFRNVEIEWQPREYNLAGQYIERVYGL